MLRKLIVSAAIYQSLLNWINRMISVISIVILARILEPVNFGLIAISVTVIDLFEGFTVL